MEIILDMEVKHHTLLYFTTIGRIKNIYHQVYNIASLALKYTTICKQNNYVANYTGFRN